MKLRHCFFTLIAVLYSNTIFSQAVLERENYFTEGNYYPHMRLNNIEYDSVIYAGNGVIWDFSNANSNGIIDTMFTPGPAGTIFYNDTNVNYNLSNLCLYYPAGIGFGPDDSLYNYLISSSDSINFLGNWAYNGFWETWWYHLTDAELYFTFPFSYTDSVSDSLSGSAWDMSGFGLMNIQGRRTIVYDGYGTLILPGVSYNNCIRIKSHRTGAYSGTWGGIAINDVYYYWFKDTVNGPLLEMHTYLGTVQNAIHYFENPTVGIEESVENTTSIYLFPNPATEYLNVQISQYLHTGFSIELSDISGKVIQSGYSDDHILQLDISGLCKGIYIVTVVTSQNVSTSKFIKE